MGSFDRYVRRVFFATLSLILFFAGIFLLLGHKPWARGIVLGGTASLANLVIMASDIRRQGKTADGQLVRPSYGHYALRMTITAAVLIYAATSTKIAFWVAAPALFTAQFIMTGGELVGEGRQEKS